MVSSIEGIGGEVIQFFLCLGVILVACLLWFSTRVRNAEEPFFRTVYVLERRVREAEPSNNAQMDQANESFHSVDEHPITYPEAIINGSVGSVRNNEASSSSTDDFKSDGERDTRDSPNGSHNSISPTNVDTSAPKIEDKVTAQTESNIKVRLKYTNDDSREVNGILQEKLVDFKRRNFPEEMSANKLIRLIFNGRLLRDDNVSLQSYGLFDDCVVHCLIINERPSQPANTEQSEQSQSYSMNNGQAAAPEWHLNKMFWFIIVTSLSVLWYCRFQFATLFTFTSTSFLIGLTAIFFCSMFGTFFGAFVPFNTTE